MRAVPGQTGGGLYWCARSSHRSTDQRRVMLVMGVLATVVASQAMITAVFSLVTQLVSYKACPAFKISRTNKAHYGQVYVSVANWLSMMYVAIAIRR